MKPLVGNLQWPKQDSGKLHGVKRTRLKMTVVLALVVVGCTTIGNVSQTNVVPTTASAAFNRTELARNFDVLSLYGGHLKSLDVRGKVAVINFWATWCEPCIREAPDLNEIYDKYKDKGVEVLGITIQSGGLDDVIPKVKEIGIKYPVAVGDDETENTFGGHVGFPMTYVIPKDGTIDKKYLDAMPFKKSSLERELNQLIEKSGR